VVRRRKAASKSHTSSQQRASFPMTRPHVSESKAALKLEQTMNSSNLIVQNGILGFQDSSSERLGNEGKNLQPSCIMHNRSDVSVLTVIDLDKLCNSSSVR
jgi:hypothetical protein